jgi:dynactin 6
VTTSLEGTVLGRCSIVGEKTVIEGTERIGDYTLIEAGCEISAREIGDDCVIESGVIIREGAVIGNNCRLCAGEVIGPGERIPDSTVVFGDGRQRVDKTDSVDVPLIKLM